MSDDKAIARSVARAALTALEESLPTIRNAVEAAPFSVAAPAMRALDSLVECVAGELGFMHAGNCEGCNTPIFDDDAAMLTTDGCWLCIDCQPSAEHMAYLREIQAACPKADPECAAQSDDDHDSCLTDDERAAIPVYQVSA